MRIPRSRLSEAPEINLIPLIDILLVIVIFLVVSTSFVRPSQLKVELPGVDKASKSQTQEEPLRIRVGKDGQLAVGANIYANAKALKLALDAQLRTSSTPRNELKALIEADAAATHQTVVEVMDTLASLGVVRVGIATAAGK